MKLIDRWILNRARNNPETRSILSSLATNFDEGFDDFDLDKPHEYVLTDAMLQSAWVNICVTLRAKNIQRPPYRIIKGSRPMENGPVADLFKFPNPQMSAASFWYQTSFWLDSEGEFFWWYGPDYKAGFPKQIFPINPRRVSYEKFSDTWFYDMPTPQGTKRTVLRPETFLHVWEPNPWNDIRGVPPIVCLAIELEQDIAINKQNLATVRNSTIPDGLIKTDQRLTPDQAKEIRDRWEQEHGRNKKNKKIAVLGSGAEFQALNPELLKFDSLRNVNRVAIATKYGIPLKVVNIEDSRTALSGKDSNEQYKALWSQTLIPHIHFLQAEIDAKFFQAFGLNTTKGEFDLSTIPELQEDDADLHKRLREDIKVGLVTINEARELLRMPKVPWGDEPGAVGGGKEPEEEEDEGSEGGGKSEEDKNDVSDPAPKKFMPFTRREA